MQKTIKTLRKKLKKEKKLTQKLDNELIESHNDIILLDQTNFQLEKENSQLQKEIQECKEFNLKEPKDEFDKHLQTLIQKFKNINQEDTSYYTDAIQYLSGYIQALHKYEKGEIKEIVDKIQHYKTKAHETQQELHNIKYSKKSLFKKINKITQKIKKFKKEINENI